MTEPHPNVKANFLDKKGWVVPLCQFCTKISPTSDTHPLPCPWLMYTTIESVVVACAHFKMLDDCASHSSAKESSDKVLDELEKLVAAYLYPDEERNHVIMNILSIIDELRTKEREG